MPDERTVQERARRFAEGVSSTLSEPERLKIGHAAHTVIEGLREICDSDESCAKVAMAFSQLIALLQVTPLNDAVVAMDNTVSAYALAAGSLAGVYVLPEQEGDDAPQAPQYSSEAVQVVSPRFGNYL